MLNPCIQFCLYAFKNKLYGLDEDLVKVIKRPYPIDMTPCLTLDNSGGSSLIHKYITTDPYEKVNSVYDTNIKVHVWCDEEDERLTIIKNIYDIISKLETNHYTYCCNYDNGKCTNINNNDCEVNTFPEHGRSMKGQCPHPERTSYENIWTKLNIDKNKFSRTEAYDLDDYNEKQALLHSVIELHFTYTTSYETHGKLFNDLKINV